MIRKSLLVCALLAPTGAHACMIVPSFWSRLGVPAVWLMIASILLFFAFRICFRNNGIWWKIPIPFGLVLVGYWIYQLYFEFNFTGAVDCGLPFEWVAGEVLIVSVAILLFIFMAQTIHRYIARRSN